MAIPHHSRVRGEHRPRTERAAELAREQFGALARRQLLECGVPSEQIRSWRRRGLLHRRYPGVYAWGRSDLPAEGELAAALLYAGRGSALSSLTVLWWQGLLGRRPGRIHVDTPRRTHSYADIAIARPRRIERRLHRGLPVVALPRALLAAAPALSANALRLVLARAEYAGALDLGTLEAALGRGIAGSRLVRRALDSHLPQLARCANRRERDFVLLCEREGLPLPEPNERIGRFRPDMLWRQARLIVELDGRRAHSTPARRAGDRVRQEALEGRVRGYLVLRFTHGEVDRNGKAVAGAVRAALGRLGR
jgi:hypothetical protein